MNETKHAKYGIHEYVSNNNATLDEQPFNEVDGLILSQVSNMDLGNSGIDLYSGKVKTFEQLWIEMDTKGTPANDAYLGMSKDAKALIQELATSPRYKDMSVSNFVENPAKNEVEGFPAIKDNLEGFSETKTALEMEQFVAVTVTYEQNGQTYNCFSYRATDGTSNGWAEDLEMAYSTDTQALSDAKNYMNIAAGLTEGYIVPGGHSKGGGEAEYGYLFCEPDVRSRIVKCYVYDSHGLRNELIADKAVEYEQYKTVTEGSFICPQDSIIGQLLHESDNAVFVHSVESGFLEHDPYSWEIDPASLTFVADKQTELSKYLNKALDISVTSMSQEEREAFFAFVSYLLYNNGQDEDPIKGLGKLFTENWKNEDGSINWNKLGDIILVLGKDLNTMTPEQREAFFDSLGTIIVSFAAAGVDYLEEKIKDWISEKKREFEQKIRDVWQAASDWVIEKRDKVRSFLGNVYSSIVGHLNGVSGWFRNFYSGGNGGYYSPQIIIDTYKLRRYAERLQAVNSRISGIDHRLDGLYWKVGLLDLWNLVQADLLTSYSWRITRCVSYLNETASDFESAENNLINSL